MYKDASTEEYITTLVLPVVTDKVSGGDVRLVRDRERERERENLSNLHLTTIIYCRDD